MLATLTAWFVAAKVAAIPSEGLWILLPHLVAVNGTLAVFIVIVPSFVIIVDLETTLTQIFVLAEWHLRCLARNVKRNKCM